ncbi:MAG: efflux RND transporter permease subunit [Bacillota bacterium]
MEKITDFILRKPFFIILILLVITGFFTYQIYDRARIETNMDKYMPEDHPAFRTSDHYEDIFNIEDSVIVALHNEEGIFNYSTLKKIEEITRGLEDIKVLKDEQVNSIINAQNIEGSASGLEIGPFIGQLEDDEQLLQEFKQEINENKMIRGRMVSEDNRQVLISAELKEGEIDRVELYHTIQDLISGLEGPEEIYIAGQPVVEGTLARLMPEDMVQMVPLVVLVIIITLLLVFRSIKSTLLTLGVVLFSTIWAFGLKSLLGIPIYVVSTMIPVMLIALGVADGIHLLVHLQQKITQEELEIDEAIKDMVRELWKPVIMTSITTSVGFISLITSEVYAVKYFGLFTAFGVIAAMIFSLVFIPAGLKILKLPRVKRKKKNKSSFFENLAVRVVKNRKLIVVLSLIFIVLGIFGLQKVKTESSFLNRFGDQEEIVQADNFINENFGGTTSLNVILEGEEDDFKNPQYLQEIEELQESLVSRKEVGDTFGLTNYLKRINKVMNDDQEKFNRIPESRELIAQYLLLYSMSGDREDLDSVVDYDYRRFNLKINLKSDSATLIKEVINDIEEFSAGKEISILNIEYAGSAYTNMVFADLITDGQIKSLFLSLVLVILLLAVMFRSIKAGLLGGLPIIAAALINFGVMGFLDISLNMSTALVSSIAVGMGIDYSIHLLSKYRTNGRKQISPLAVVQKTMSQAGRAIVFNAAVVIMGFMVLTFSSFTTNRELGWLVSLSLFNSFVLTLTLVVVLIDKYKPEFIFSPKSK